MDKKTQDLTWASLPKEARDRIKIAYKSDYVSDRGYQPTRGMEVLQNVFGHHNLTSDTEPEEMLMVERKIVIQYYKQAVCRAKKSQKSNIVYSEGFYNGQRVRLDSLFGDKCLPDKIQDTGFGGMSLTPPLHKLDVKPEQPSVQVEPKFKVGDIVRVKYIPIYEGEIGIIDEIGSRIIEYHLKGNKTLENDWFTESYLEHYTEPETKDTMEEKELNPEEDFKMGDDVYLGTELLGKFVCYSYSEHHKEVMVEVLIDSGKDREANQGGWSAKDVSKTPQKPKRWRAKYRETYYSLRNDFSVCDQYENNDSINDHAWDNYNYFRTKEEAQQAAEVVKEALQKFHEKNSEK